MRQPAWSWPACTTPAPAATTGSKGPPMRLMLDSTTPAVLPVNVGMIAGYINGRYAWTPAEFGKFPGARVRINVTGVHGRGTVLDVESGDAKPSDAPGWYDSIDWIAKSQLAIYCNRTTLPAVIDAMGKRDWRLWLATLDGSMPITYLGRHVDAVQVLDLGAHGGPNIDVSFVRNDAWHAS